MKNKEIAQIFEEIGELLELNNENPFKIRAYQNGARVINGLGQDIEELARTGKLTEVKGIGQGLKEKIEEFLASLK